MCLPIGCTSSAGLLPVMVSERCHPRATARHCSLSGLSFRMPSLNRQSWSAPLRSAHGRSSGPSHSLQTPPVAPGLGVRGEGVGAPGGRAPRELKFGEGMPGEAARGATMEGGTAVGLARPAGRAGVKAEGGAGMPQAGGQEEIACGPRCRESAAASQSEWPELARVVGAAAGWP
eukprot:scaffold39697_cov152-Isochrysis_galbana.AAC.1